MKKIKAFLRNVEKQYEDDDVSLNYNRLSFRRQFLYLNLHSLRHTFASLALKNNVDIKSVQNILRHADASTTLNTYASAYEDKKRSVIKDMEAKWIKISFTTKKADRSPICLTILFLSLMYTLYSTQLHYNY